jgi:glycosyltransferase involved in cell wall biosynthesis
MTIRLAIVTTHPIQYQVPWFRALAAEPAVELTVFYCQLPDAAQQGDGFGVAFAWDVPLLEGYRYEVLPNVAKSANVTTFRGCDNPALYEKIQRGRFDAVIVNGWVAKSCLQALFASRRAGIPCIVRGESNAIRPRAWWKRQIHRSLLRQYAAFLVIGSSNAEFYRGHGISPRRMFPGLYCVDNARFTSAADRLRGRRNELRAAWGISEDATVVMYCGKFIPKKHPLTLLRSASLACNTGTRLHLLLAGDGELRPECESFARTRQVPATFIGFLNQSRLAEAYVAADCLTLPSDDGETWGLVVNEAMACGRAAIVSDRVGCAPDLIIPGRTGEVFPFGDEPALAEVLSRMGADRHRLVEMGQAARSHVANYSIDALTSGTLAALDFACAPSRRAARRTARND